MPHRTGMLAVCLFLASGIAFPQTTLTGTLGRIADDHLVIQTEKSALTVAVGITTKFYKGSPSGAMIRSADFQPGDHVSITATQDAKGAYHAETVSQVRSGTPAERAAAAKSAEADPDETGPPELRRGIPRARAAAAQPAPGPAPEQKAEAPAAAPRRALFPSSGDPVIDRAREAAFAYAQTLPNFTVRQVTTRYDSKSARGGQIAWQAYDTITADVISENGKESYRNILENGHPPTRPVDETGSWSTGEYSSVLLDVLSLSSSAKFHDQRPTTIVNRPTWRYDYNVDRSNSHWEVESSTTTIKPEYGGTIWIDKESFRTLRLELAGRNMPQDFELDTVETAVDYDFVMIGDSRYLLPVHAEILSCYRSNGYCGRNVIDFRNYRKFTADSSIRFDQDDKDAK